MTKTRQNLVSWGSIPKLGQVCQVRAPFKLGLGLGVPERQWGRLGSPQMAPNGPKLGQELKLGLGLASWLRFSQFGQVRALRVARNATK